MYYSIVHYTIYSQIDFQWKTFCAGILNSMINNIHEAMITLTFYKGFS